MDRPLDQKSTVEQIRARFDADVERFSRLETGQQATIDAPLVLELVSQAAAAHVPPGGTLLDLGCGAGNFTLSVLARVLPLDCTLVDLSGPMLVRAGERVAAQLAGEGSVTTIQSDLRTLSFEENRFDVILAGAVLHHLRGDAEWQTTFRRLHSWLRPGGTLFVADLVTFDAPAMQTLAWQRSADYLDALGGPDYRQKVLTYIDLEDSPRSLRYQLDLLQTAGFAEYDVLHRNSVFATYYARKG